MRGRDRPPAGCDRLANRAAQASGSRRRPAMAWSSSDTTHDERHGGLAKDSFAVMAAVHAGPDSRWTRYPARAPRERAILRHASRFGVERGRCRTRRRTELTTWTLSLSRGIAYRFGNSLRGRQRVCRGLAECFSSHGGDQSAVKGPGRLGRGARRPARTRAPRFRRSDPATNTGKRGGLRP